MKKALLWVVVIFSLVGLVNATGCYIDWNGGNSGCRAVESWGNNVDINKLVKNAAKNNPGVEYMGWCPYDGATPYAKEIKAACNCPDLKPAPGECISSSCGACGNPVTKCAPEEKPYCGDGKVNRPGEECDDGNSNNNDGCDNTCHIPKKCLMTITKDDSKDPVLVGEYFYYDIVIKNTGTADCTGGGVLVHDYYPEEIDYVSSNMPPWKDNNEWNFGVVEPGEEHRINIKVKVKENAYCPKTIINKACVWAAELSDWICAEETTAIRCIPCQNECISGEKMCSGTGLLLCGNYDSDECTEWKFKEECYLKEKGNTNYVCDGGSSVGYIDIKTGYCKDSGNYDFCATAITKERASAQYCGKTECKTNEYCMLNDVYATEACEVKGCYNGACYQKEEKKAYKVEDCGDYSKTGEFCDGENIAYGETFRECKQNGADASCKASPNTVLVEKCGPDTCTSKTKQDIWVKESVLDDESCAGQEYPFCAMDTEVFDFCLDENMLEQAVCNSVDHGFVEFDCSSLSGCYAFPVQSCVLCPQEDGSCQKTMCNRTGQEYREYKCGDGTCRYEVDTIDTDNDKIDDRCDVCIDVDHDGICDDKDNCIGKWNENQIDSDNDGIGNACDNDIDDDGYPSSSDCNDWNSQINPDMQEVKNNGIDDDCNLDTPDKGVYMPRQALFVDLTYDDSPDAGGMDRIKVSVTNYDLKEINDLQIIVTVGIEKSSSLIYAIKPGQTAFREFEIDMPENSGYEQLRVSVSNLDYKRIIYRELSVR